MVKLLKTLCILLVFIMLAQLLVLFKISKGNVGAVSNKVALNAQHDLDPPIKFENSPNEDWPQKQGNDPFRRDRMPLCIAILAGTPPGRRKNAVPRLLYNLVEFAEVPTKNIHVFYENIDPRDLTYDSDRLRVLIHSSNGPVSASNNVPEINAHKLIRPNLTKIEKKVIDRQNFNLGGIGFMKVFNNGQRKPRSTKTKLRKYMTITQNYKFMLDRIFKDLNYKYCTILEDDLLLSMDAGDYLEAGITLMEKDSTIMSVSLFNDNSFSWCASNETFFHRVEHFGGLGFLMSGRHYVDLISPKLNIDVPWDTTFEYELGINKLVTIIPEVSRSLHMENQAVNTPSDLLIPGDNTEAISMYNGRHIKHTFDNLQEAEYDEFITRFVREAYHIDHIEDVAFFSSREDERVNNFVFTNCDTPEELGKVMESLRLVGMGNGGVVRGVYKDTVFLRPYGSQVLIVCKPSIWYQLANSAPSTTDLIRTFVDERAFRRLEETMGRSKIGVLYRLENFGYEIRKGRSGQSCFDVCTSHNEICDTDGIAILDTNCRILKELAPEYKNCKGAPKSIYKSKGFYLPAMDRAGDWVISKRKPTFYFYNCHAFKYGFNRICACKWKANEFD
ncbi:unnamed protein product [Owenia fusiformis]|uniref:Alpha-1,3-mannosyl-glycoprotein 2-beta-N-acetylglucosaminyltransferase n=1 Tax=Owenia fusiformis TaxID=6347 RepID=A0A8J1YBA9_OWEFU|nr:unnamed protein product [Owenia fusiformis]